MNTSQQFQLKIGVYHHPVLKTDQLISFLKNQSNDFLTNQLPQNLMIRQTFYSVFEIVNSIQPIDFNEYVGFIILYSSSSRQTYEYACNCLPAADQMTGEQFLLFVEMDNTEKKLNVVGQQGELLCQSRSLLFIRLTLKNPEDLVANLNRNLYLMIQNYYYPNEEERHKVSTNFECQINPNQFVLQYSDSEQKIIASSEEKHKVLYMIEKAAIQRSSRQQQMVAQQSAIDESIENVQKVLNNINKHIKQKFQSEWFTKLRDSLYKPIEKESRTYNKIKLTQQFIDEPQVKKKSLVKSRAKDQHESIYNSKYNSSLQQSIKRLQSSLIKIVIMVQETQHEKVVANKIAELQVFENSSHEELASNALKKLGISVTQRNIKFMKEQIKFKIQTYVRQLSRGIKNIERQRTFERSYLAAQKK